MRLKPRGRQDTHPPVSAPSLEEQPVRVLHQGFQDGRQVAQRGLAPHLSGDLQKLKGPCAVVVVPILDRATRRLHRLLQKR